MKVPSLVAPLLQQEIFQGLSPLQITEIVRRADRVIYRPGQTLIEIGEIGDTAIIIVAGQAVRTEGPGLTPGPFSEELIEPGSLLGEMSMLIDREHTSTVIARTDVKAICISRETLQEQMYEDPALAEHMADKISSRLDDLIQQLQSIETVLQYNEQQSDRPASDNAAGRRPEHMLTAPLA